MSDESIHSRKKRHDRHPLVLIIEEEESIRALVYRVLEAEGCAVMTASDTAEAISLLETIRTPSISSSRISRSLESAVREV